MGKSSQLKGAAGERELASLLREYGYDIERGGSLSFWEVPDLVGLPGIHIECKRVERLNLHRQCPTNCAIRHWAGKAAWGINTLIV